MTSLNASARPVTLILWDIERTFTSFSTTSHPTISDSPAYHGNLSNCTLPERPKDLEDPNCAMFRLVFNSVVIGLLCVLGVTGNTLSILVLHKDRMNQVAVFLLQCLAFADNSLLIVSFISLSIFYGLIPYVHPESDYIVQAKIVKYMMPIGYMTQTAAIWMTVLLAINRYIAICRPFEAHRMCTYTKAKIQVAVVFTFSILFNVPRFFQYEINECYNDSTRVLKLSSSPVGRETVFGKVYTNALYSILVLLLPLLLLLFLNTKIILEMRKAKARMRKVSYPGVSSSTAAEENISIIMVIIVINFIVCHLPDRLFQMTIYFPTVRRRSCASFWYIAEHVCNFLVIVSSSSNFIIYYVFRKRFRSILKNRLFHCEAENVACKNLSFISKDGNKEANGTGNKRFLLSSKM